MANDGEPKAVNVDGHETGKYLVYDKTFMKSTLCEGFSIRGYAAEIRKRNINKSWPFRQHLLETRLKEAGNRTLPALEIPKYRWWKDCGRITEPGRICDLTSRDSLDSLAYENDKEEKDDQVVTGILTEHGTTESTVPMNKSEFVDTQKKKRGISHCLSNGGEMEKSQMETVSSMLVRESNEDLDYKQNKSKALQIPFQAISSWEYFDRNKNVFKEISEKVKENEMEHPASSILAFDNSFDASEIKSINNVPVSNTSGENLEGVQEVGENHRDSDHDANGVPCLNDGNGVPCLNGNGGSCTEHMIIKELLKGKECTDLSTSQASVLTRKVKVSESRSKKMPQKRRSMADITVSQTRHPESSNKRTEESKPADIMENNICRTENNEQLPPKDPEVPVKMSAKPTRSASETHGIWEDNIDAAMNYPILKKQSPTKVNVRKNHCGRGIQHQNADSAFCAKNSSTTSLSEAVTNALQFTQGTTHLASISRDKALQSNLLNPEYGQRRQEFPTIGDEIPVDIVELMAKTQHERGLSSPKHFHRNHDLQKDGRGLKRKKIDPSHVNKHVQEGGTNAACDQYGSFTTDSMALDSMRLKGASIYSGYMEIQKLHREGTPALSYCADPVLPGFQNISEPSLYFNGYSHQKLTNTNSPRNFPSENTDIGGSGSKFDILSKNHKRNGIPNVSVRTDVDSGSLYLHGQNNSALLQQVNAEATQIFLKKNLLPTAPVLRLMGQNIPVLANCGNKCMATENSENKNFSNLPQGSSENHVSWFHPAACTSSVVMDWHRRQTFTGTETVFTGLSPKESISSVKTIPPVPKLRDSRHHVSNGYSGTFAPSYAVTGRAGVTLEPYNLKTKSPFDGPEKRRKTRLPCTNDEKGNLQTFFTVPGASQSTQISKSLSSTKGFRPYRPTSTNMHLNRFQRSIDIYPEDGHQCLQSPWVLESNPIQNLTKETGKAKDLRLNKELEESALCVKKTCDMEICALNQNPAEIIIDNEEDGYSFGYKHLPSSRRALSHTE